MLGKISREDPQVAHAAMIDRSRGFLSHSGCGSPGLGSADSFLGVRLDIGMEACTSLLVQPGMRQAVMEAQ